MKSIKLSKTDQRLLSRITDEDATDTLLLISSGSPVSLARIVKHLGHNEARALANLRRLIRHRLIKSINIVYDTDESPKYFVTARGFRIAREILTARRQHALE